jgi:3-dehydrotetronate 4-kinase
MSKPLLGCIADDFTGATDLASNLVRSGMRVVQTIGIPAHALSEDCDAVVVALKTRTVSASDAIAQSLQALDWLQVQGAQQFYFKYCSTFDSTPEGNIGPVTEALMDALGETFTIASPAFPENGRTIFKGHLFVGDVLLSASGMKDHPLTPMRNSNLVHVLQEQTKRQVGLIEYSTVTKGPLAIRERISQLKKQGIGLAIVDALSNEDLMKLGPALADLRLITAGSGVAIGLAQNFGIESSDQAAQLPRANGRKAIISGSCSVATNAQVAHFLATGGAGFAIDPLSLVQDQSVVDHVMQWVVQQDPDHPILIYATAKPESVRAVQSQLGVAKAGSMVEEALSDIAQRIVSRGIHQLVVAGGETSGACVKALGIESMRIGAAIAPGVPWCHASSPFAKGGHLHITLKSGNFGTEDFFTQAFQKLA